MAITLNFMPRMKPDAFIGGCRKVLDTIYAPKSCYKRVFEVLGEYRPAHLGKSHVQRGYVGALFKSILFLGVIGRERIYFWKLFFWSLTRRPRISPLAITYAVFGFHFRKNAEKMRGAGCSPETVYGMRIVAEFDGLVLRMGRSSPHLVAMSRR
jgi:Domain of unknown function (DUF4070)